MATSIASAAILGLVGVLAIGEVVDDVDEGGVRLLAVLGVLMLLSTALPPLIRRIATPGRTPGRTDLAAEVIASTGRILALNPSPEVKRECERLREAARAAAGGA